MAVGEVVVIVILAFVRLVAALMPMYPTLQRRVQGKSTRRGQINVHAPAGASLPQEDVRDRRAGDLACLAASQVVVDVLV